MRTREPPPCSQEIPNSGIACQGISSFRLKLPYTIYNHLLGHLSPHPFAPPVAKEEATVFTSLALTQPAGRLSMLDFSTAGEKFIFLYRPCCLIQRYQQFFLPAFNPHLKIFPFYVGMRSFNVIPHILVKGLHRKRPFIVG